MDGVGHSGEVERGGSLRHEGRGKRADIGSLADRNIEDEIRRIIVEHGDRIDAYPPGRHLDIHPLARLCIGPPSADMDRRIDGRSLILLA